MQPDQYRNHVAISISSIKDFRWKSVPRWYDIWINKQEDPEKDEDNFTFGSLTDMLCFTPQLVQERFFISEVEGKLPSKFIIALCKHVYKAILAYNESIAVLNMEPIPEYANELPMSLCEEVEEYILQFADTYREKPEDAIGWQMNWKTETRLKKIIEEGKDYFAYVVKAAGRKVISTIDNMAAIELKTILCEHEDTKPYFLQQEGEELIHQLEMFLDYTLADGSKIPVKGAIDIVRIDHKNKVIYIVDFKTAQSAHNFIENIKKYGYCDQLSFYIFLFRIWIQENRKDLLNYKIELPTNIVIDRNEKVPYIYEYNDRDLEIAQYGNEGYLPPLLSINWEDDTVRADQNIKYGKIRKGWEEILEEIGWHWNNNQWTLPKELFLNKKIKVNLLNN